MKTKLLITAGLLCFSSVAFCANSTESDQTILSTALEKYLAQQGNFCLGKYSWPIDLTESDFKMGTREALQMPVLEKQGLVVSSYVSVMRKVDDKEQKVLVKRHELTEAGKKFYLSKETQNTTSSGEKIMHHGDFCAAKLSLNTIVRWDKPEVHGENKETTVAYTYKIAAAKWTQDPEIQKVFPMLARIVKGEGTLQLKQRFRFSGESWVAVNAVE